MMPFLRRVSLLVMIASLLAGCGLPQAIAGIPVAAFQGASTATPAFYQPPADATATATPFQPLPPTEVYLPTNTPEPTATPQPTSTPTLTPLPPTETPIVVATEPQVEQQEAQPDQPKKKKNKNKGGGLDQPDGQINILLLGSDKRHGDPMFRTDTIILATLNPKLGTINLTSFPRDLYINIPGYGTQRINTAFKLGEFELLAQTFQENFGVYPDHYVLINFWSFKQVVDSLGGLEVEVGQAVSDYRNGQYYTIPKGQVKMDADTVLWYSRSRKTSNDFARARRQQEVLRALFEKMISLEAVKRIPEFYSIYRDNVKTDLGLPDILSLLPFALKLTDTSHLNHYYIGPQQTYDWITYDGAMVLLPNPDAIREVMEKALNLR